MREYYVRGIRAVDLQLAVQLCKDRTLVGGHAHLVDDGHVLGTPVNQKKFVGLSAIVQSNMVVVDNVSTLVLRK